MRDGSIPAGVVLAALGLMLAFAPRKAAAACIALAIALAWIAGQSPFGLPATDTAIMACWAAVFMLAVGIFWRQPMTRLATAALSAIAGAVAGTAIAASAGASPLWPAALAVIVIVPATIAVDRGYAIAPRVVMSWLVAVALLAALLPQVVSHPGYVADHRG